MRNGTAKNWRIRITGFQTKPASAFKFHPLNWRRHGPAQRAILRAILGDVGWVQGVIENQRTGNLIDGHARIEEALRDDPAQLVPYIAVDLAPAEEKAILAALDPIAKMAETDPAILDQLLRETFADLPGLEQLLNRLHFNLGDADPDQLNTTDEWVGAPPGELSENPFKIVFNFETEKTREQFARRFRLLKFLRRDAQVWASWYPFEGQQP